MNRSQLYDSIYNKADRLFKKYNPCNICNKDGKVICANKEFNKTHNKDNNELCCLITSHRCYYHSDNGCITKNLSCKLFICPYMWNQMNHNTEIERFCKQLKTLIGLACKNNFITSHYFVSREKALYKDMLYQQQLQESNKQYAET